MPAVESPRSPAAAAAADEEAAAKALLSVGASTHFTPQHQKPATSAKRGLNLDAHQDPDSDPALASSSNALPPTSPAARSVTKKRKVGPVEAEPQTSPAVGYRHYSQKAAMHPPAIAVLQREIETAYPMNVLKLPRKQWNQWREKNTPPVLTDAAIKYLTTYRRLCLARLYSEKSRQMKRHSADDLKVTVKALRKENTDLRKRLSRYEAVELTAVANNDAEAGVANDDEDECTLI